MRQWKLTPEEEAEVLERYDQSTPEIKRGIALEFAKRAVEGAVLVRKFQAALDAERAKVAGLVAALEKAHYSATGGCGLEESEHPESPYHFLFAAIRAAKEGTVPTQPEPLVKAAKLMAAVLQGFTGAELVKRVGEINQGAFDEAQEAIWEALSGLSGEGTVPT